MRQILHELRTPANAIQIAAEIIQQNLFGEIPHEYRALAASIASDTAQILAGFDELDRLVKLETGAMDLVAGESELGAMILAVVRQLEAYGSRRDSGFAVAPAGSEWPELWVGLAGPECERLLWRVLAGLAGSSAPGERLALTCARAGANAVVSIELPAILARREGDALFASAIDGSDRQQSRLAGVFGIGLTLRLAAAEARKAGGALQRNRKSLALMLPLLRQAGAASRR